jgi:16S rRNA (cytosine1402-N4)-methyltransferase
MEHSPVMYAEALQHLAIKENGTYLDCTFGRGGHSSGILKQLGVNGHLFALDRDLEAIRSDVAQQLLADSRFSLIHSGFANIASIANTHGISGQIDGILMDLGVSSPQLDNAERGFSFLRDGPLDMRMDNTSGLSAAEWLATVSEKDLVQVLFDYGEERFARRIAKAVIMTRSETPLTTTKQLAELISNAVPYVDKFKHPATRSFQAIRIAVNNELDQLKTVLADSINILSPGGRLVIIAFHSLEDRIVKRFIKNESGYKFHPGKLPVKEVDINKGLLKSIGKAIKASDQETAQNPRARSAIMRVAERN